MKTPKETHRKNKTKLHIMLSERSVMFPGASRLTMLYDIWGEWPVNFVWKEIERERGRERVKDLEYIDMIVEEYWQ